ncbi:MAG: hypothetical protein PVH37_13660 [Desulfobacterales bacterium]|jgi:hypothetical protein
MKNSELGEREKKILQTGLFDNLTVQDAFTINALFATQIDPVDWKDDLDRIMIFLRNDPIFDEDYAHTLNRLNKFANSMKEINPSNALERAAKVLTPEMRQKSFILATQICKATQEMRTKKILQNLASKLQIEKETIVS